MTDASAESRDRAIAEANALRQENAELLAALRGMVGLTELLSARSDATAQYIDILATNHRVVTARALLAKGTP